MRFRVENSSHVLSSMSTWIFENQVLLSKHLGVRFSLLFVVQKLSKVYNTKTKHYCKSFLSLALASFAFLFVVCDFWAVRGHTEPCSSCCSEIAVIFITIQLYVRDGLKFVSVDKIPSVTFSSNERCPVTGIPNSRFEKSSVANET